MKDSGTATVKIDLNKIMPIESDLYVFSAEKSKITSPQDGTELQTETKRDT